MTPPAKLGRPTTFNEAVATRILELATEGDTDVQISAKLGIAPSTLSTWKNRHPDFKEALKDAKQVADELVEAALFQRACGYSQPAVNFHYDSKRGEWKSQAYVQRHPPDVTACIFWLKNRRPDLWRDSMRQELVGRDGGPLEVTPAQSVQIVVALPANGREADKNPAVINAEVK